MSSESNQVNIQDAVNRAVRSVTEEHEQTNRAKRRERIAAAALTGILSGNPQTGFELAGDMAVHYADAVIEALSKST